MEKWQRGELKLEQSVKYVFGFYTSQNIGKYSCFAGKGYGMAGKKIFLLS